MKAIAPVLSAGSAFTGAALAGLLLGIVLAKETGQSWWVFGGLMGGLAVGAYGAVRLLQRSI